MQSPRSAHSPRGAQSPREDGDACGVCNRAFELPPRLSRRAEDIEYACVPRLLRCLHAVCQSCLEELSQRVINDGGLQADGLTISCPYCSEDCTLPPAGVSGLPYDSSVLYRLQQAEQETGHFCAECHDEEEATHWCPVCSEALCEYHQEAHTKGFATKMHELRTLEEFREQKQLRHIAIPLPVFPCADVSGEPAKYYCVDCERMICTDTMIEQHQPAKHEVLTVRQQERTLHSTLNKCHNQCGSWKSQLTEALDDVADMQTAVRRSCATSRKGIQRLFRQMRSELDNREAQLLRQLEHIETHKRTVLREQANDLTSLREHVVDALEVTSDAVETLSEYAPQTQDPQLRSSAGGSVSAAAAKAAVANVKRGPRRARGATDATNDASEKQSEIVASAAPMAHMVGVGSLAVSRMKELIGRCTEAVLEPKADADVTFTFSSTIARRLTQRVEVFGTINTGQSIPAAEPQPPISAQSKRTLRGHSMRDLKDADAKSESTAPATSTDGAKDAPESSSSATDASTGSASASAEGSSSTAEDAPGASSNADAKDGPSAESATVEADEKPTPDEAPETAKESHATDADTRGATSATVTTTAPESSGPDHSEAANEKPIASDPDGPAEIALSTSTASGTMTAERMDQTRVLVPDDYENLALEFCIRADLPNKRENFAQEPWNYPQDTVVVEARRMAPETSRDSKDDTDDNGTAATEEEPELLGYVVVITELEGELTRNYDVRSHFESCNDEERGVPVIRYIRSVHRR